MALDAQPGDDRPNDNGETGPPPDKPVREPRRAARLHWLRSVAWLLGGLVFLLLVVLPTLSTLYQSAGYETPPILARSLPLLEPVYTVLLVAVAALWLVMLGGSIASFLNVVASRVPRRQSILGRSHCPKCHTQLSFAENLPIFGWLACSGQCRHCGQPISARYVWVELILGTAFLLIGVLLMGMNGWSLPPAIRAEIPRSGPYHFFEPDLWLWFASQTSLTSSLFAFALLRLETRMIPVSVVAFVTILGWELVLSFPQLRASHALGVSMPTIAESEALTEIVAVAVAWLGGGLIGLAIEWMAKAIDRNCKWLGDLGRYEPAIVLSIVGLFLGFWPALFVGLLSLFFLAVWNLGKTLFCGFNSSFSQMAFVASVIFLALWRFCPLQA